MFVVEIEVCFLQSVDNTVNDGENIISRLVFIDEIMTTEDHQDVPGGNVCAIRGLDVGSTKIVVILAE